MTTKATGPTYDPATTEIMGRDETQERYPLLSRLLGYDPTIWVVNAHAITHSPMIGPDEIERALRENILNEIKDRITAIKLGNKTLRIK